MRIYKGLAVPPYKGKIGIVVSEFNKTVTQSLLDGCLATLTRSGVEDDDITVVWVPGAFEIPTVASVLACNDDYAAVICLGCVIKGETSHDVYIAQSVSQELVRIGSEMSVPVIFGVLTCDTNEQAMARAGLNPNTNEEAYEAHDKLLGEMVGNKGVEAAEAALKMLNLMLLLSDMPTADNGNISFNTRRYKAGEFDSFDDGDWDDDDFDEEEFEEELDSFNEKPKKWDKYRKDDSFGDRGSSKREMKPKKSSSKGDKGPKGGTPKGKSGFHSDSKSRSKDKGFGGKGKGSKKSR